MSASDIRYLVGIDLGTTHTVVAYLDSGEKSPEIRLFAIEQLIAPGEIGVRPLLPSVRYHPAEGELGAADYMYVPGGENAVLGEAARFLGAKSHGRFVSSAKSWLSHPSVDHTAAVLPWGSADEVVKVSPLEASASYLAHVRTVWGHRFPEAPLERQDIVITVPASFDEAARSLTLEAARLAGLKQILLLEEPQAVCYDWLRRHHETIKQTLADIHLLLVCDVGGGTTDLTLIKIEHHEQRPKLTRIGVGDHLMLGGDNLDLALAHLAESRLIGKGKRLSAAGLSQLIEQCRIAKERLLADDAPESLPVTLLGGGGKLIGGTRSVNLSREEIRSIALDGFFPLSAVNELPDKKRSGVVEFGLPYAAEPAVSKHIAAFLNMHRLACREALNGSGEIPDAVLFNGGVFRSKPISDRVLELIASWRGEVPAQLDNKHPELAVAFGAVSYALARRDKNLKIGGGAARSYFLVIETEQNNQQQGICILPKGSEEGYEIVLQERQFALRLGQPVRFHLASLTGDTAVKPGDISNIDDERFHSLPPLAVALDIRGDVAQTEVIVRLSVMLTEVGTLQIQCVAVNDAAQRWDVEFQIRKKSVSTLPDKSSLPPGFERAAEQIQLMFGKKSKTITPKTVKGLRADLEKQLGPRAEWETPLLRELFMILMENSKNRRRSANHERIWISLVGFCLRPGFGYPLDDWRIEQVWKIFRHNIQFVTETQNWTEWWTLWRRIAGGLNSEAQEEIFSELSKYINPAAARQGNISKQGKQRSYEEMVRLAAVLERLPVVQKIHLGEWLLKRLQKTSEPSQTWWSVGRVGARIPFHAASHHVIPVKTVSDWLAQVLLSDWKKIPQAGFAATLIARKSGDRVRDVDNELRRQIIDKLKASKAPSSWIQMLTEVRELDEKQEKQIFGEALPPGLKLIIE